METPTHQREFETLIFEFRGIKVMIDTDLAMLYGTSTKRLKEQVKRNLTRFPEDFMFSLSSSEFSELVANCDRLRHLRHSSALPMAFTEQGVAMLSSVLHSETAIRINIEIMRAFARYRALIRETESLKREILLLDEKFTEAFRYLLERLDALHQQQSSPRQRVGYKIKGENTTQQKPAF